MTSPGGAGYFPPEKRSGSPLHLEEGEHCRQKFVRIRVSITEENSTAATLPETVHALWGSGEGRATCFNDRANGVVDEEFTRPKPGAVNDSPTSDCAISSSGLLSARICT